MAIEYREKRIGSHVYRVTQHGTKSGLRMLVRVTKIAGPGVGSFIGGLGRDASGFDVAVANGAAEALHDLAARLNEAETVGIVEEFARQTVLVLADDLQPSLADVLDDHFAGHYDHLLQWLVFCLEVNFGSFFAAGSGDSSLRKLWTMAGRLRSQPTSSGTSTASQPAAATPTA